MSQIVSSNQMSGLVDTIISFVKENIEGILIVTGFILGFSIVAALIETWNEDRLLSKRRHL
jgi:hypothetical protein